MRYVLVAEVAVLLVQHLVLVLALAVLLGVGLLQHQVALLVQAVRLPL
jgi:hypothetical protein